MKCTLSLQWNGLSRVASYKYNRPAPGELMFHVNFRISKFRLLRKFISIKLNADKNNSKVFEMNFFFSASLFSKLSVSSHWSDSVVHFRYTTSQSPSPRKALFPCINMPNFKFECLWNLCVLRLRRARRLLKRNIHPFPDTSFFF